MCGSATHTAHVLLLLLLLRLLRLLLLLHTALPRHQRKMKKKIY
jgi:hypothetical protein